MSSAAEVIEILGEKFYRRFVQFINELLLKQYQEQFGSPENSVL